MHNSFWLSVLFWVLTLSVSYAQSDSSYVYLHAKLINAETEEALPYAHVLLKSKALGMITNEDGIFTIRVLFSDTLVLSSIGFERKEIVMAGFQSDSSLRIIPLEPHVYELGEIVVTQYPTYERLKEIVTNPEYTNEEKMVFRALNNIYGGTGLHTPNLNFEPKRIVRGGVFSPFTAIFNLVDDETASLKKREKLEMKDEYREKVLKRVSTDQIKQLTGLKDSVVVERFIEFCKFDLFTLNDFSDYEIFQLIIEKYKAFRKKH